MRILFSLIFHIFLVTSLWAQGTTSNKAQKLYEKAQEFKKDRQVEKAIESLNQAIQADPSFALAHYDVAGQYFMVRNEEKAIYHYRQAVALKPEEKMFTQALYMLAVYEVSQGKYQEGQGYAQRYLASNPSVRFQREIDHTKRLLATCEFAFEAMKNPISFQPVPLPDRVNKFPQQYFPVLTADRQTLIFTGRIGLDENMYVSVLEDGQWSVPEPIKELNTPHNEGTCTISADGKTLIFTACEGARERPVIGACDLFVSYKQGGNWSKPINMGNKVNSRSWESQPALSADGRVLYFVSDRPGGFGGKDIWVTKKDAQNEWTVPVNMGNGINTSGDEVSPFIHVNGKALYFASKGHLGMGGLDLFMTEWDGNTWGTVRNLGYPINDHHDQVSLFITSDGEKGYYSIEKYENGRIIASQLAHFDIPQKIKVKQVSDFVKGRVFDSKTQKPLGAQIRLTDLAADELISSTSADPVLGDYLIVLNEGAEYALHVEHQGYLYKSLSFSYEKGKSTKGMTIDIPLEPLSKGSVVALNNIFFESGSYELLPKSKTELDKLIDFLKVNPDMRIEIGGHTDDVGSDESNRILSLNRARSVVEYLAKHEVPKSRLTSEGYGESKPIVPNTSEENRALNRRIEFKIL
jgi:outer membrane protein OmpA-like peptidoglycan-associated protein/tetratricopeptide (TPR) repeat protein